MIDLETMGVSSRAPILAIGAVEFDRDTCEVGEKFYQRINWESAFTARKVDASTVHWWMKQGKTNPDAVSEILKKKGSVNMKHGLEKFSEFIDGRAFCVWGNGATFDITILETVYEQYKLPTPWEFWNVRDCRTVQDIAEDFGLGKEDLDRSGQHHNALDDAIYQAEYISYFLNGMKGL